MIDINEPAFSDRLELLSPSLIQDHPRRVQSVDDMCKALNMYLGWHDILDLVWVLRELETLPRNAIVVDAGGGTGLLQFLLTARGYRVISVDSRERVVEEHIERLFPIDYLNQDATVPDRYRARGDNGEQDRAPDGLEKPDDQERLAEMRRRTHDPVEHRHLYDQLRQRLRLAIPHSITFYKADFRHMHDIPTGSVDAVVSVSAIEHTSGADLAPFQAEFMRVLKPGGRLLLTTSAALEDHDRAPSNGWCFSEATLRQALQLDEAIESNFSEYDQILEAYRQSEEMKNRLSPYYFSTWRNGMPWGIWDPSYVSVGIRKTRPANGDVSESAALDYRIYNLLYGKLASLVNRETNVEALQQKDREISRLKNELEMVYATKSWKIGNGIIMAGRRVVDYIPILRKKLL